MQRAMMLHSYQSCFCSQYQTKSEKDPAPDIEQVPNGRSYELCFADSHLFHCHHNVSVLLVDQHLAHTLLKRTLQCIVIGQLDQALQWWQQRAGPHADVGHRVGGQGQNVIKEMLLEKCLGVEFDEVFAYDNEKTSAVTAAPMTKIWKSD